MLAFIVTNLGIAQTTVTIDFETVDDGYTASGTAGTGFTDVFNRVNPNIGGNSTFIWAVEDMTLVDPTIDLDQIDVTGATEFTFSLDMIAHHFEDWDSTDELLITYSTNNKVSYQNLMWVQMSQGSGDNFNGPAALDLAFDNDGDCGVSTTLPSLTTGTQHGCTVSSSSFATFSTGTISLSSVTTLDIKLQFNNLDGTDEGIYLDDIVIEHDGGGSGCTAPTTQASAYNTTALASTSATLNWTSGDGDEVLVLVKEGSAVDTDPTNGTTYSGNTAFGSGSEIGTGNYAVYAGTTTSTVSITGLTAATTYHVAVYEYNTTDTCYELTQETGSFTTTCSTPNDVSAFTATDGNATVDLSWTNGACFDEILVVAKAASAVTVSPTGDGTAYTANATFGSGTDLGTGEYAVYKGTGTSVTVTGLTNGTTYHFEAFARKVTTWSAGVTDSATPNAPTLGWQISSEDTSFVIDFDTTVSGVNEGAFDGSGFTSSPTSGQLDSDAWEATGMSDGSLSYGGSETSGDFARGSSTGGVTSGGFYAFDTGGSNNGLGSQGTGSDFTPGTITLRAQNQTGNTVTAADLEYLVYVYNDQGRASTFNFEYSTDDSSYTAVGALDLTSTATADGSPAWVSNSKSTSITGLSIADGDFLYLRWTSGDDSGSGSRDEFALDDIDLTFNPVVPTTYTYSGSWSPSDPNGASTASEFIVIASGNATIDTNTTCDSVTVNAGAGLTIDSSITLTVSNGLNLESSSTSYSSLILDGSVTGTINYDRHVNINGSGTTGSNDLISPPLTGQAFNTFASANSNILSNGAGTLFLFGPYDKTTGDYLTYADTETATLDAGVGYRAASDDNGTFTFTGTANNGTVTNDITNGGATEFEWNLVGNPYPSYLNVQAFLNHDVDPGAGVVTNLQLMNSGTAAIYGYDGSAPNGWTILNLANTTASTVIAPGQGFFVSADATNAPLYDLEFTPAMRSTGTTDDFIVGREAAGTLIYFKLNASTASDGYDTEVYFNPLATLGFNFGFDAELFNNPAFVLYTELVEWVSGNPTQIALQTINTDDLADTTIPLGLRVGQGEQVTFSLTENTLPATTEVFLDDTEENIITPLHTIDYVFTPATAIDGTGRFFIRVFDETLSTTDNSFNYISISAINKSKEIVVRGQLKEDTTLTLFDIQGRQVLSTQLDSSSIANRVDTSNLSAGVYVVNLNNNEQNKSQKVIIK